MEVEEDNDVFARLETETVGTFSRLEWSVRDGNVDEEKNEKRLEEVSVVDQEEAETWRTLESEKAVPGDTCGGLEVLLDCLIRCLRVRGEGVKKTWRTGLD